MRNALATLGQMVLAAAVAVIVAVISLIAIAGVQWPAFPSSNQLHALTTVGQVGCLAGLVPGHKDGGALSISCSASSPACAAPAW